MSEEDDEGVLTMTFTIMQWAEVCAALRVYAREGCKAAPHSFKDAVFVLREVDKAMGMEPGSLDDLLGGAR